VDALPQLSVDEQHHVVYGQLYFLFIPLILHYIFGVELARMLPQVDTVQLVPRTNCNRLLKECKLCEPIVGGGGCATEQECMQRNVQVVRSLACLPSINVVYTHWYEEIVREQLASYGREQQRLEPASE